MPKIYKYIPVNFINDGREETINVQLPYTETGAGGTILTQLGNTVYFVLFDGNELPVQRDELIIEEVVLTPELKEEISKNSLLVKDINRIVREKIAERYDYSDEIKLLRTAPSAEFDVYNTYAEDCRNWGRTEKAKYGV